MWVRQAYNKDEDWLLEHSDELNIPIGGFRSRDYVVILTEDDEKIGTARVTLHNSSILEINNPTIIQENRTNTRQIVKKIVEKHTNVKEIVVCPSISQNSSELNEEIELQWCTDDYDVYKRRELLDEATSELVEEYGSSDTNTKYET